MTLRILPFLLATLVLACGAPTQPPVDAGAGGGGGADAGEPVDSGTPDAGTDAGSTVDAGVVDAGAACDSSTTPCTVAWTEPEKFPVLVDHHTTLIYESAGGAHLYVLGGVRAVGSALQETYAAVRRAKIKPDGTLEAWSDMAGALPQPIGFAAQATHDNLIYIVGGITMGAAGPAANGKTFVGELAPADGLITWKQGPSITETTVHGTALVLEGKLYLIGGSATSPKATVLVSSLGADGMPGAWAAGPALPVARSHHAAVVHGGQIFLIGGFGPGNTPLTTILRSVHDANGAITGWMAAGDMPNAPWTAGASVWGDSLFVVGGGEGGPGSEQYVNRVRQARFLSDNTVSGFADLAGLPAARSHVHQAPIYNGRIYSVGGRLQPSLNTMDRVFIGTFQ